MHTELDLPGVYLFSYPRNVDLRGHFERVYNESDLDKLGLNLTWPQHNSSFNKKAGTIRGLHFQTRPKYEDKYVRCTSGKIYEVLLDLRPDSTHYLKWITLNLSEDESHGLYIPGGVAHGFQTLVDGTVVNYLNSINYNQAGESGINPVKSSINFHWPLEPTIISERDLSLPII